MLSKMTTVVWNMHWGQDMVGSLQRPCLVFPSRRQRRQRSRAGDHVLATAQVGRWELPWWMSPPNPSSPAGIALGGRAQEQNRLHRPSLGGFHLNCFSQFKATWNFPTMSLSQEGKNPQSYNSVDSRINRAYFPMDLWLSTLHPVLPAHSLIPHQFGKASGTMCCCWFGATCLLMGWTVDLLSWTVTTWQSWIRLLHLSTLFLGFSSCHETCWKGRSLRFLLQYETEFELANIWDYSSYYYYF